ncbi:hypothetical protein H5410_052470 [Solanum commersonii]|uniref:Uncharacterized protein n=1 Tax=Solanum commersonii TaxID=4109 RepID=A0A9J5X170_SOLCO|nr:hypothetical protein H5410_052470 [Solanum commersonii]
MAFKLKVASTSDCPPDKNCSNPDSIKLETCHDSRYSWGNSSMEELKSIISNLLWSGSVFAFSTRSDHTLLEENTLKHDIVLSY